MHANPDEHRKRLRRTLAILLGSVLAIIVVSVVAIMIAMTRAIPVLTPQQFTAAQSLWDRKAPSDYNIKIEVSGMQPATYRVEVRDGLPVSATRNGNPLRDQRTLGTWSVPGMFGTVGRDVESIDEANASGIALPLFLRAEFDPRFGYPRRYLRSDEQQHQTTSWEVVEFQVLVRAIADGEDRL